MGRVSEGQEYPTEALNLRPMKRLAGAEACQGMGIHASFPGSTKFGCEFESRELGCNLVAKTLCLAKIKNGKNLEPMLGPRPGRERFEALMRIIRVKCAEGNGSVHQCVGDSVSVKASEMLNVQ